MMNTLVPAPTNNNRVDTSTGAHNGINPPSNLTIQVSQSDHSLNNNQLSDKGSEEALVDTDLDIATRIKQHKEVLKEVFMPVYVRNARSNSDSRSPSVSPIEGHNLPQYLLYRNQPLGKPASKGPARELSYEEELQNRQQQLLDAVQVWRHKYKDKRTENIRLLVSVQRAEEDCCHIIERIAMEYQAAHDSMKVKLADIVCYADDVTQERNRVERELRESLEKAKEHVISLETRLSSDKQEILRLRALTKRLEKERNQITQEHNRLKQENDALWDKCKKAEEKMLSPSVSELKFKYDTKQNSEEIKKQCHILEMEREHYALLLDAALQRLQTYESGLANLIRTGIGGKFKRKNSGLTVTAEPGDPTKICIIDRKNVDGISRFSDIEEEEHSEVNSALGDSGSLHAESDTQSRHSPSRPGSLSEDFSETDSLQCSSRFDGTESLASHLRGSSSADDSSAQSDKTPPTPRSINCRSFDTAGITSLRKSASSPGTKPKKNLTRSSSEHAERETKTQASPTPSTRSSQLDDKNSNAASSFGVLRQRRGGVVNLPPASLLVEHSKTKKPTWGRDILDKLKKKSSNPEKITDKKESSAFWQRNKSKSVKVRGEKGKEKSSTSLT